MIGSRIGSTGHFIGSSVGSSSDDEGSGALRKLVIIAGQSNAIGQGLIGDLTDPSYLSPYSNVIYMANMGTSADPPAVDVYSAGALDDKVYQGQDKLGIELSLGRDLDHTIPNGWAIAKFAYSSTSLNANWDPNGTWPTAQPNIFTQFCSYIVAAEAATNSELAAIIWIQGENDAGNLAQANDYDDNLLEFVDLLRVEVGTVPFIYGRLHTNANYAFNAELRVSQANCNGARTDLIMVDQDVVAIGVDLVHYDADELIDLGLIYADEVLDALNINARPYASYTFVEAGLDVTFTDTSVDRDGSIASRFWDFGDGQTSTATNPVHTYAGIGTYTVSLTVTDNSGGTDTYQEAIDVDGANWAIDATSGIALPQDSTEVLAMLTAAGSSRGAPLLHYNFQDSGSPIADANAIVNLPLVGSGASYQQAVTGWSALCARLTEATTGGWLSTDTALPDLSTTSILIYAVLFMPAAAPAATRNLVMAGTTTLTAARWTTASMANHLSGANQQTGTANPSSRVMPVVLKYDRTGGVSKLYTDQEALTATHSAAVTGKRLAFGSNGSAASAGYVQGIVWTGADAEWSDAEVKTFLQTAGWTIPW